MVNKQDSKNKMTKEDFDLEKFAETYPDAAKELLSYTQALDAKILQKEGRENFIEYIWRYFGVC